jgi:ABC-type transport system involved in cytochrome bd biosynthesis fused ATPase/permease subunit
MLARLRNLPAMPSILLISHNMETINLADAHYNLQNGQLSEVAAVTESSSVR